MILLNIAHEPRRWSWRGKGTLLLSTHLDRDRQSVKGSTLLRADEGVIIMLEE
jgi:alpha-glucosidase